MRYLLMLCPLIVLASLYPADAAHADEGSKAPVRTERVPAMRERAYKQLTRARDMAEEGDHGEALKILRGLREDRRANGYEKAMAWNLTAYVSHETHNTSGAIEAYQAVLNEGAIPTPLRINTLYGLAQMYMSDEQWPNAASTLEKWFALNDKPGDSAYLLLGSAYYQMEAYDKAREPLQTALRRAKANSQVPRENLLLLLRSIHYAQRDFESMLGVVKTLAAHYSKREYWVQLSAIYSELDQPDKQLAAMMAARDLGLFERGSDYRQLAQLLLNADVPQRAGEIIDEGLAAGALEATESNLTMLADAWMLAKNHAQASDALERAARLSQSGEINLRLAQVELEIGNHRGALAAARDALRKGGLSNPNEAHVIAGLSLFELEQLGEAKTQFSKAAEHEQTRDMARQWTRYIDKERERRDALAAIRQGAERGRGSAS